MTLTKNLISSDILKNYFGPESQLFKFISISNGISSSLNPEIEYREIINTDLKKIVSVIISNYFILMLLTIL